MGFRFYSFCFAVCTAAVVFTGFSASAFADAAVKRVEPVKVCMVNNTLFPKDQIPVEVEGKTYYGCCQMCKKTLRENPDSRIARDPVSGRQVDKAAAVIGAAADNQVYYFENEANLRSFAP